MLVPSCFLFGARCCASLCETILVEGLRQTRARIRRRPVPSCTVARERRPTEAQAENDDRAWVWKSYSQGELATGAGESTSATSGSRRSSAPPSYERGQGPTATAHA